MCAKNVSTSSALSLISRLYQILKWLKNLIMKGLRTKFRGLFFYTFLSMSRESGECMTRRDWLAQSTKGTPALWLYHADQHVEMSTLYDLSTAHRGPCFIWFLIQNVQKKVGPPFWLAALLSSRKTFPSCHTREENWSKQNRTKVKISFSTRVFFIVGVSVISRTTAHDEQHIASFHRHSRWLYIRQQSSSSSSNRFIEHDVSTKQHKSVNGSV